MLNTLIGTKVSMGQAFVENTRVPVTVVKTGPCTVTQIKNFEKDGYWAVQLGFGEKRLKNTSKALQGHLKKVITNKKAPRFLCEVKFNEKPEIKVGDTIKVSDIFAEGDIVTVTGTSKGKGFAGVVKRWKFAGGPKTHGQSDRQRAPGSIGQGTTPGRVLKGKHMAGRMGHDQVTIRNLKVVAVNPETNELSISSPIPGTRGSLMRIKLVKAAPRAEKPEEQEVTVSENKEETNEA